MSVSSVDLYMLKRAEHKAARKATVGIREALKSAINDTMGFKTYQSIRTANSRAKYKDERLQRVTVQAEDYIFKNNYGFEGKKKNGVNMRLKANNVVELALQRSGVVEALGDEIAALRGDMVTLAIQFMKYPNLY